MADDHREHAELSSPTTSEQRASGTSATAAPTGPAATAATAPTTGPAAVAADAGDEGYAKSLQPRHVGMIAIGGAIGTGLLLGAGGKLLVAGPALAVSYAIAGIFAYLVEPAKIVPRAVRSVTWRIGVFYVGSVLMLAVLLPWNEYSASQSPFVTVLSKIGVGGIGGIMNLVVLTAAMSSLNSGFYSTGRVLRSMAGAGSAPRFTARMNSRHVPYGGILLTCGFATLGVGLNAWLPGEAFEIVVNFASLGVVCTWVMIMLCHLVFVRRTREAVGPDRLARPSFRLKGWPWVNVLTIAFLAAVIADMGVDGGTTGAWTVASIPLIGAVLATGWVLSRTRKVQDGGSSAQ